MISELEIYSIVAVAMSLITVAFGVVLVRKPPNRRLYYLPVVLFPGISAIGFLLMARGILWYGDWPGQTFPAGRLFGWLLIFTILGGYVGFIGGLGRRSIATLAGCMSLTVSGIILGWAPSPLDSIGPLMMFAVMFLVAYLLLRPYHRRTRDLPGDQRLLFDKLKHILLLVWVTYILGSMFTRSRLGLWDAFTTVSSSVYVDAMWMAIVGVVVLRSSDAIDQVAEYWGSDDEEGPSGEPAETPEAPLADSAD